MANPNFLILDEPTNDLDILTLNTLEAFLNDFEGCVLIASHDRYMTDKVVDHLFIMDGKGEVLDFNGSYSEYLTWQTNQKEESNDTTTKSKASDSSVNEYELRKKIRSIEGQIERLEQKKTDLENKFQNPEISIENIKKWNADLKSLKEEISQKENDWIKLVDLLG